MDWRLALALVVLWSIMLAAVGTRIARGQEPDDRVVEIVLQNPDGYERVELWSDFGVLESFEVTPACGVPCVLPATIPDVPGDVWAVGYTEFGITSQSPPVPVVLFPTVYQRADINGDGSVDVLDLLLNHRMIFAR